MAIDYTSLHNTRDYQNIKVCFEEYYFPVKVHDLILKFEYKKRLYFVLTYSVDNDLVIVAANKIQVAEDERILELLKQNKLLRKMASSSVGRRRRRKSRKMVKKI